MLRLAADETFNGDIVRAVLRRKPEVDIVRVQDVGLSGADDPAVLEWAAREGRVLLTHDVRTMTRHAYERVPVGSAIEDVLLLAELSLEGEWEGQVRYLPLR